MSDEEKLSNLEESNVDAKTLANRKKREKKKAKAAAQKSDKVVISMQCWLGLSCHRRVVRR